MATRRGAPAGELAVASRESSTATTPRSDSAAAQQPTRALRQRQSRRGEVDVGERAAARRLHRLASGLHERIVGSRERQPVDDHEHARRSRHVDALPERPGRDETRGLLRGEPLEQRGVHLVALRQDQVLGALPQRRREPLDGPPRGAQHERPTARGGDERGSSSDRGVPQPGWHGSGSERGT